jgi:hypothetical protein
VLTPRPRALCSVPLQVDKVKKWWQSERFLKTKRPYTAEEVVRLRSPLTRGQLPEPTPHSSNHAACPIRSAGSSVAFLRTTHSHDLVCVLSSS